MREAQIPPSLLSTRRASSSGCWSLAAPLVSAHRLLNLGFDSAILQHGFFVSTNSRRNYQFREGSCATSSTEGALSLASSVGTTSSIQLLVSPKMISIAASTCNCNRGCYRLGDGRCLQLRPQLPQRIQTIRETRPSPCSLTRVT